MAEKPKKSKQRIPQWQFILVWIGGQYAAFFALLAFGVIAVNLLGILGFSVDTLPSFLSYALAGIGLGWVTGWVQQWAIKKHFGHEVKGWRIVSALLSGLAFAIVIPLVIGLAYTQPALFEGTFNYTAMVSLTFMAIFGASGLGQAILLRKHVKSSWLFFFATLVGGIVYGLPNLGSSPIWLSQTAQLAVTAFTLIWLFGMSGGMDALRAEGGAIERLSDSSSDEAEDEWLEEERQSRQDNLWQRLLHGLRVVFAA